MTKPEYPALLFEAFLAGAQTGASLGDDLQPHFDRWLARRQNPPTLDELIERGEVPADMWNDPELIKGAPRGNGQEPDPEHVANAEALKQRIIRATQPILDGDWAEWDRMVALLLWQNGFLIEAMVRERRPVGLLAYRVERVVSMIEEKVKQDDLLIRSLRALAEHDTPSGETARQLYEFKQAYAAAIRDPAMVKRLDEAIAEVDAEFDRARKTRKSTPPRGK